MLNVNYWQESTVICKSSQSIY